jgi:hypothetical protein
MAWPLGSKWSGPLPGSYRPRCLLPLAIYLEKDNELPNIEIVD